MIHTDGRPTIAHYGVDLEAVRECDGYPGLATTCLIEDVPEGTIMLGVMLGLMRRCPDGVYEFTEKGDAYFREWLAGKLAAAACTRGDPGDCSGCGA